MMKPNRVGQKIHEVDWCFSYGRYWLKVNGYLVAMQGDPCRDGELLLEAKDAGSTSTWDKNMLGIVLGRDLDKTP